MKNPDRHFARRIDLTSLQLFVAVCELGSIGRAAEREFIAASAVSKRLSDLETAVGSALLYRHSRGVTLTPAGESLLHHARTVLFGLERMQGELSEYADGVRGHVRVHANISAIVQFLPEDLGAFAREHAQVKIDLQEHLSPDVLHAVREGAADLGLCHTGDGAEPQELQSRPYRSDRLVLVVPEGHPLAGRPAVRFEDVLDWDIVGLQANSSISLAMRRGAARAGRPPAPAHPGHGPGRHVPHDRQRPRHRAAPRPGLRADARRGAAAAGRPGRTLGGTLAAARRA